MFIISLFVYKFKKTLVLLLVYIYNVLIIVDAFRGDISLYVTKSKLIANLLKKTKMEVVCSTLVALVKTL